MSSICLYCTLELHGTADKTLLVDISELMFCG